MTYNEELEPMPEDDTNEITGLEPAPVAPNQSGWGWVGSPDHPKAQEHSDGISDLFTVDDEDIGAGSDVDDLIEVDIERDIIDANEETGDLSDLVDVTEEDIMGNELGQSPLDYKPPAQQRIQSNQPRYRLTPRRTAPPTSMRGIG
ncbi:MAG: hypothetical protein PHQ43_05360 [Dehalococcoidales bacterium]|nr:hypothetical protein [Dehalococcoidales bacterium]